MVAFDFVLKFHLVLEHLLIDAFDFFVELVDLALDVSFSSFQTLNRCLLGT